MQQRIYLVYYTYIYSVGSIIFIKIKFKKINTWSKYMSFIHLLHIKNALYFGKRSMYILETHYKNKIIKINALHNKLELY